MCVMQEVWACWCELLSYLEQENAFLDQLEQKLDETENLQGGAEELHEALDVSMKRMGEKLRNKKKKKCTPLPLIYTVVHPQACNRTPGAWCSADHEIHTFLAHHTQSTSFI